MHAFVSKSVTKDGWSNMKFYLIYKNNGLYDPVLDESEPVIDLQPEDFDQPSSPPSEVFQTQYFEPIDLENRSLTASPFLAPTKPYRPFSTEPLEVPPLEEPIILNPDYRDEFRMNNVEDDVFSSLFGDINVEAKYKLPVNEKYDPNAKQKILKQEEVLNNIALLEESIRKQNETNANKDISIKGSIILDVKNKNIFKTEINSNLNEDVNFQSNESYKTKKFSNDCISQEFKEKVEIKSCEDLEIKHIEETAMLIVEDSINRAVSVTEEINKEIGVELYASDSHATTKEIIENKSQSNELIESKSRTEREFVETKTEKSHIVNENRVTASFEDVLEEDNRRNEQRKSSIMQEIQETIEVGSVKQRSEIFNKDSEVNYDDTETAESRRAMTFENHERERVDKHYFEKDSTRNAHETSEQRVYSLGLQTIPNIRGSVTSSHHYDLLLKTFFIHLTDVMVALSRFMLSQPVAQMKETSNRNYSEQSMTQSFKNEQKMKSDFANKEMRDRSEFESVDEVTTKKHETHIVEKKQDTAVERRSNEVRKEVKSGAKMSQLCEKKTEQLTHKMDAVISEFESKSVQEQIDISSDLRRRSRSRSRIEEEVMSDSDPLDWLDKHDILDSFNETKNTFTHTEAIKTDSKQELHKTKIHKTKPGKQTYLAIVESHVYTNKDAIIEDYAAEMSETASVQSEEINIAKESMETMSTEKVAIEPVIEERALSIAVAESTEMNMESKSEESTVENMNAVVSTVNNYSSAKKETVATIAVAEAKEISSEVQETNILNSEQFTSETAQVTHVENYSSAQKTSVQSMAIAKSTDINIELSETNSFETEKTQRSEANILSIEELSSSQISETKSLALAKCEEIITETYQSENIETQELKTELASTIVEEDYTQTVSVNETNVKQNTDITIDEKLTLKKLPEKTHGEESAALKIVKYQVVGEGDSVHMTNDTEIEIREDFELKKLQETVEEHSESYSKHESIKSTFSESKFSSSEISMAQTEASKTKSSQITKLETDICIQNADCARELDTQLSIESDENNNTSNPPIVPPTPLTDEYVFSLEFPLPKSSGIIPIAKDITPEKDEDPHIVKKRLIPHIETTIESVVYDEPLQTPTEDKPSSPVYSKPGLKGGSELKEEIREIERKSSLLASAIDETIKSIEEYKESVGMETTAQFTFKSEHKSKSHEALKTLSDTEIKMNGFSNFEEDSKVTTSNMVEEHAEKSLLLENTKQLTENVNSGKLGKEIFSEENNMKQVKLEIVASEQVTENAVLNISERTTNEINESEKQIKMVDTASEDNEVDTKAVVSEDIMIDMSKIERPITNFVRMSSDVEEPKVNVVDDTDRSSWKTDELLGFRPVHFDPDAEKGSRNENTNIPEPVIEEQRRTYMTPDGELLGTVQGIVDGLEEAVVDDDVAKELGKPGIPEDKIAVLISGESEMLREAHVMGLARVLSSHMHRPDDSSVDFHKIKPLVESLRDSEVLKALNEELLKTKAEQKKKDDRKWTTFLQKPKRPVPRVKFGYYGYVEKEEEYEEPYKVQIVKQPKPKVAPDYKSEDFETGPLPWEERAEQESSLPPVEPEEPILVPEETPQFLEAVDPLPESEVPDLEDTGLPLPEPTPILPEDQKEESNLEEVVDTEVAEPESELELERAAEAEETERVEEIGMDQNRIAEQLLGNVQNMIDPNAPMEQQLIQMRQQLAALAQLPGVIQQTLEQVSRQFNQLSQMESLCMTSESHIRTESSEVTDVTQQQMQNLEASAAHEERHVVTPEPTVTIEEVPPTPVAERNGEVMFVPTEDEVEKLKQEEEEMKKIEKQKKVLEQNQLELESRMVKQRPTPRVGKPKRVFGPLSPEERPIVLPGGRKWRGPKDAYNEQMFAETLQAQAELIQGKALGSFESELLPYDGRINFMKYEKPPVSLDHLQRSEVLRMIQNQDDTPKKRVELLTPVIAEADYRERVRSMTPNSARAVHFDLPQQLQP